MKFTLMEQHKVRNYSSLFVSPVICPRRKWLLHDRSGIMGLNNKNPSQLHVDCVGAGGYLLELELSHSRIAKVITRTSDFPGYFPKLTCNS